MLRFGNALAFQPFREVRMRSLSRKAFPSRGPLSLPSPGAGKKKEQWEDPLLFKSPNRGGDLPLLAVSSKEPLDQYQKKTGSRGRRPAALTPTGGGDQIAAGNGADASVPRTRESNRYAKRENASGTAVAVSQRDRVRKTPGARAHWDILTALHKPSATRSSGITTLRSS